MSDVEVVHVADGRRYLGGPQSGALLADRTCRLDMLESVTAVGVLQHHVDALPVLQYQNDDANVRTNTRTVDSVDL